MEFLLRLYTRGQIMMNNERGAGLAEYALLLFLIALAAVAILTTLGGTIAGVFSDADDKLSSTTN